MRATSKIRRTRQIFATARPAPKAKILNRLLLRVAAALALATPGRALAGPPFITDDPEPVEPDHWEVYVFSAGAIGAQDATGFGPSLEVNYGAAPNLQLHLIATTAYDSPQGAPPAFGLGDTELGAKYRLVSPGKDDWYPQIGMFPLIEVPTGRASRNLGAGEVQAFLPVWLQKDLGKWTTYGGGGYWINPGPGNRNYWYAGWLLQRQFTATLMLGAEVFHQTASMVGHSGTTGFNLGGQYDLSDHHHLLFSAGHGGLTNAVDGAAVSHPFTYYLGFQWTF
ncbi:MAG: hypothetical protein KGK11_06045 [Sphingomonadales bacterium]|nr:hypothetical protein [Sphingomonadales bacterium]